MWLTHLDLHRGKLPRPEHVDLLPLHCRDPLDDVLISLDGSSTDDNVTCAPAVQPATEANHILEVHPGSQSVDLRLLCRYQQTTYTQHNAAHDFERGRMLRGGRVLSNSCRCLWRFKSDNHLRSLLVVLSHGPPEVLTYFYPVCEARKGLYQHPVTPASEGWEHTGTIHLHSAHTQIWHCSGTLKVQVQCVPHAKLRWSKVYKRLGIEALKVARWQRGNWTIAKVTLLAVWNVTKSNVQTCDTNPA